MQYEKSSADSRAWRRVFTLVNVRIEADEQLTFKLLSVAARGSLDMEVCPDEVDKVSKTGVNLHVRGGSLIDWIIDLRLLRAGVLYFCTAILKNSSIWKSTMEITIISNIVCGFA